MPFTSLFAFDIFGLLILPLSITVGLIIYFYHAKKHSNIETFCDGYLPIIGSSFYFYKQTFIKQKEHDSIYKICKNKKILCLSFPFNLNFILINDLKIIKFLFNEKEKYLFISKNQFNQFRDLLGLSLSNLNGDQYNIHKTKSIKFFNNNFLKYNDIFDKHSKLLIDKITKNEQEFTNLNELLLRASLASFCHIYLGTDLNLIESFPNNHPFLNAFNQCLYYVNKRFYKSHWKILRYFNFGTENVIKNAIILMDSIITTICESRKKRIDKIKNINSKLKNQNKQNKLLKHSRKTQRKYANIDDDDDNDNYDHPEMKEIETKPNNLIDFYLINDDEIELQTLRDNICNFLYSSRDYLALLLSWFFYEITLDSNKNIYNKIIKEINDDNNHNNKYLENCLYETLRLHPIKPLIIRQSMINIFIPSIEKEIKRNDLITIPLYSLGRNTKIWGKDAFKFKPSRFENKNNDKYKYQIFFGFGTRSCFGKQIGINAAKIYIVNILKYYDIIPKPHQNITYTASVHLHLKNGFYCKLIKRR